MNEKITMPYWLFFVCLLASNLIEIPVERLIRLIPSARAAAPDYMNALPSNIDVVQLSGVGPDGKMAPIRVDSEGHVVASQDLNDRLDAIFRCVAWKHCPDVPFPKH